MARRLPAFATAALLAAAAAALAGCQAADGLPAGDGTAAAGTSMRAAVGDASAPAAAAAARAADATAPRGRVVLDLREPPATVAVDAGLAARARALVYGDGAPSDVRVVAAHEGAFTVAGRTQVAVLLARGDGVGPAPAPPMLAVLDGDRVAAQFVPDPAYAAMPAAADVDGDGLDELLLVSSGYQMGQAWDSVDVASLAAGRLAVVGRVVEARLDGCDNPAGERVMRAAVLAIGDAGLRTDRYVADCVAGGGTPRPDAFRPVPAGTR